MVKTTVYLPKELEIRLDAEAAATGVSKAELIRRGISLVLEKSDKHRELPPLPSFTGGTLHTVEQMDDALYQQIKKRSLRR